MFKKIRITSIALLMLLMALPLALVNADENEPVETRTVSVFHQEVSDGWVRQFEIKKFTVEKGSTFTPTLLRDDHDRLKIFNTSYGTTNEVREYTITRDTDIFIDYIYLPLLGPYTVETMHQMRYYDDEDYPMGLTRQLEFTRTSEEGTYVPQLIDPLDYDSNYTYDRYRISVYDGDGEFVESYYNEVKPILLSDNVELWIDYIKTSKIDLEIYINGEYSHTDRKEAFINTEWTIDPEAYITTDTMEFLSADPDLDVVFTNQIQTVKLYYSEVVVPTQTNLTQRYITLDNANNETILDTNVSVEAYGSDFTAISKEIAGYEYSHSVNHDTGDTITFPFTLNDNVVTIDHIYTVKATVPTDSNLTQNYITLDENNITKVLDTTVSVETYGSNFTTAPKAIEGYEYSHSVNHDTGDTITLPFTLDEEYVTIDHVYTLKEVKPIDPTDDEDTKDDKDKLPQTGVSSNHILPFILLLSGAILVVISTSIRKKINK